MTQELTLNGRRILAVDVPKDAKNFTVIESRSYFPSPRVEHSIGGIDLPKGQWSILGRAGELTEEQARGLVEHFTDYEMMKSGYKNYAMWAHEYDLFPTALESFQSWLRANNLSKQYLLIDKK